MLLCDDKLIYCQSFEYCRAKLGENRFKVKCDSIIDNVSTFLTTRTSPACGINV